MIAQELEAISNAARGPVNLVTKLEAPCRTVRKRTDQGLCNRRHLSLCASHNAEVVSIVDNRRRAMKPIEGMLDNDVGHYGEVREP